MMLGKEIIENKLEEKMVEECKKANKFDVYVIAKVIEDYIGGFEGNEEKYFAIYRRIDFKWIRRQLGKN